VEPSDNARPPDADLAQLARDIGQLRDALVLLSLALRDFQFETDTSSQVAARATVDALMDRAKTP
jgi:hypothetical protein